MRLFRWFVPECPVDRAAKAWIEDRLNWLREQFGLEVVTNRPVILPTSEFFPDKYDSSFESARKLLDRVCSYMNADPCLVHLEFFSDANPVWFVNKRGEILPRAAGMYDEQPEKTTIHIESQQLHDPMNLVGTVAHELAHMRLLGERRVTGDEYDHELLTDLTAVYHGLGIFLANSPRAWISDMSIWPGTNLYKPSYMTLAMYGYALAHLAWVRGERKPAWAKYLRSDAHCVFKESLRYLHDTGDSRFKPAVAKQA